jgi:hypothetical protein
MPAILNAKRNRKAGKLPGSRSRRIVSGRPRSGASRSPLVDARGVLVLVAEILTVVVIGEDVGRQDCNDRLLSLLKARAAEHPWLATWLRLMREMARENCWASDYENTDKIWQLFIDPIVDDLLAKDDLLDTPAGSAVSWDQFRDLAKLALPGGPVAALACHGVQAVQHV